MKTSSIIKSTKSNDKIEKVISPDTKWHPRIFKNKKCFDFCNWLIDNIIVDEYADCSIIYRMLKKEGFIYNDIRHQPFMDFLTEKYGIVIGYPKFKIINLKPTSLKLKIYANGKKDIRPSSKAE